MIVPVLTKVSMVVRARAGSLAAPRADVGGTDSPDGAEAIAALFVSNPLPTGSGSVSLDEDEGSVLPAESCATK